jgi:hypothetical protein
MRLNRLAVLLAITLSIGYFSPTARISAAPAAPNPCVGIASDSNGYGHVTFQLGADGDVGIVYVQPFWVILQDQLQAVGLGNLKVLDRSLSASGLTASEATNYLKSIPYGNLIRDRCRFDIVGPFLPDVAAGQAKPENYAYSLQVLVNGLVDKNPGGTIFVLKFYQTDRAEFTVTNSGRGLTPERINAFNDKLTAMCSPDGSLGSLPQVVCVDTQPVFDGMDTPYRLYAPDRGFFSRQSQRAVDRRRYSPEPGGAHSPDAIPGRVDFAPERPVTPQALPAKHRRQDADERGDHQNQQRDHLPGNERAYRDFESPVVWA